MENSCDLSTFSPRDFDKGAGIIKRTLWYFVNALLVRVSWNPFMGIKIALLKAFGAKICISQGALLLTGNHNYTVSTFDYRNAPIVIEDGAWIGAKAVVCPGVMVRSHAILTVGSVATKEMNAYGIYQGNPAKMIRKRIIN